MANSLQFGLARVAPASLRLASIKTMGPVARNALQSLKSMSALLAGTMLTAPSIVFGSLFLAVPSFADTLEIPISKDARIMQAHRPNNTGAEPVLWLKSGNGADRIVVEFDISSLIGTPLDSISSARVQFVTDYTRQRRSYYSRDGFQIEIRRLLADFAEGNGIWDRYRVRRNYPSQRGQDISPKHATGLATTFDCAIDTFADNGKSECEQTWNGAMAQAPGPVSTPIVVYREMPAIDGLKYVNFDVTNDLIDLLSANSEKARYLIKKRHEYSAGNGGVAVGRIYLFSKESAAHYRDERLTPKLIVEVDQQNSIP